VTTEILESAMPGIREGETLAGKYRISSVIGAGGMGVVFAAHHLHLDEKVAIKVLHPNVVGVAEAVDRFVREARSVVKIKSEHVVRVTDVDRLPDGSLYMVMEYLEGLDLAEWLLQRGALPISQSVDFVLQACEAAAEAHALGIIHRDLKPGNLFCVSRSDGQPLIKVLDFGISKAISSSGAGFNPGITGTNVMLGSPLYMSPEQMHTPRDVDARTDIWALGVILYELLTSKLPFDGESVAEIWAQVNTHPPAPLSALRPGVPKGLEAIILKCLEKDRENRFANVADLAIALATFGPKSSRNSAERISRVLYVAGLSDSAITYPPSSRVIQPVPESQFEPKLGANTVSAFGYTRPGVKRKRVVTAAIVSAVVVMAVAIHFAFFSKPKSGADSLPTLANPVSPSAVAWVPAASVAPVTSVVPSVVNVPSHAEGSSPSESAVSAVKVPVLQQGAKVAGTGKHGTSTGAPKSSASGTAGTHKAFATTPNLGGRL